MCLESMYAVVTVVQVHGRIDADSASRLLQERQTGQQHKFSPRADVWPGQSRLSEALLDGSSRALRFATYPSKPACSSRFNKST